MTEVFVVSCIVYRIFEAFSICFMYLHGIYFYFSWCYMISCQPWDLSTWISPQSRLDGWMNQAYSRLSTTHGHITDCKLDSVVYAGVGLVILMWTCLVWAEQSTPNNFWVPSHRFNSATGEQKGITQTIYTGSEPTSRMPNSLMPSTKLRSANLPFLTSLV